MAKVCRKAGLRRVGWHALRHTYASALGYGKSLHDALAEVHARALSGDLAKPEEAPALVDRHLHVPYAYNALREDLRGSAIKAVTDYLETNDLRNVEFSEKVIELNLGNGVRVTTYNSYTIQRRRTGIEPEFRGVA